MLLLKSEHLVKVNDFVSLCVNIVVVSC